MARGDLNHLIGLVTEDHIMGNWVDGWPTGEKDGVFEHGVRPPYHAAPLIEKNQGGGYGGPLRVPNNALERTTFVHDLEEELQSCVGALMRACDALLHQLAHRVLGSLTVGKVPDAG